MAEEPKKKLSSARKPATSETLPDPSGTRRSTEQSNSQCDNPKTGKATCGLVLALVLLSRLVGFALGFLCRCSSLSCCSLPW